MVSREPRKVADVPSRSDDPLEGSDDLANLVLDRDAEVPIGVQLAWALRARIRDGRFAPGQRLPGLRDLAEALGVNANTVRAVYQRLEHEGIIDSMQGSGTFVTDAPSRPSAVGAIAANAAQEALDTGVDPREVAAALYVVPKSTAARTPADTEASRRRQLRTRITALELALGDLQARHPGLTPRPLVAQAAFGGPRLLGIAELEEVEAQLIARLAALHSAIEQVGREGAPGNTDPPAHPTATAAAPRRAPRHRAKARPATAGA